MQLTKMRCDRQGLTLTTAGCARLWESAKAKRPQPWEGRSHCVGCPVGAANAGKPISSAEVAASDWADICPRCLRPADRLINGTRCVSCYNRHAEALRGRNAKGNRPHLADQLCTIVLAVSEGQATRSVQAVNVVSRVEVMVASAKRARGALAFGIAGAAMLSLPELSDAP